MHQCENKTIEQLSVFLENKSGRLTEVLNALANADINIKALSLADTSDFGILRLILSDTDKAKKLLKENGFTLGTTKVVAVEVPDKPGGLNSVLKIVSSKEINVEYMYAYIRQDTAQAVMIFRFDKIDLAIEVLKQNSFTIMSCNAI